MECCMVWEDSERKEWEEGRIDVEKRGQGSCEKVS
jgi:hypothetical protein